MTLEITKDLDDDGNGHIDITYDGEYLVSIDAHESPPSVCVFEADRPEDAFAHFKFDEGGEIDRFDLG